MPPRSMLLCALLVAGGALAGLVISSAGGGEARPTALGVRDPALDGVAADRGQPGGGILPRPRVPAGVRSENAAAESWLHVRVVVTDSFRDGLPVRALGVQAGLGHPGHARVAPLAVGTTDADGIAELEIPWSAVEAQRADLGGRGFAWARPCELGWMEIAAAKGLPETHGTVEIRLVPRRGVTLRGRLVAEDGTPAMGSVEAHGATARGPARCHTLADASGGFELHLEAEGRYDLLAQGAASSMRGGGPTAYAAAGAVLGLPVDSARARREYEIRLVGSGVVRGRVVIADGRPAAGVDLDVESVHLAADHLESSLHEPLAGPDPLLLEGLGGVRGLVRTGADGEFEVRGLRPGLYGIAAPRDGERRISDREVLTAAPVPCDGTPLVLTLPGARLLVRAVGPDGRPWERAPSSLDGPSGIDSRWPAEPGIVVAPVPEAGAGARNELLRGNPVGGALAFDVAPGGIYAVGLLGGAYAWRPERAAISAGGSQVDVTLAPVQVPFGKLTLSVSDAEGAARSGFEICVEDPLTQQVLVRCEPRWNDEWPLALELPAGAYRVRVEGRPSTDFMDGTLFAPSRHGRFEAGVQVAPGRTLALEALLPAGARIDITLRGSAQAAGGEALERGWPGMGAELCDERAEQAEIRLLCDGRWPHPVAFRHVITGTSAEGTQLRSALPLGTRQVSEIVPAGSFVLEARLPGGRVATAPVVLVDGQTTVVALDL